MRFDNSSLRMLLKYLTPALSSLRKASTPLVYLLPSNLLVNLGAEEALLKGLPKSSSCSGGGSAEMIFLYKWGLFGTGIFVSSELDQQDISLCVAALVQSKYNHQLLKQLASTRNQVSMQD